MSDKSLSSLVTSKFEQGVVSDGAVETAVETEQSRNRDRPPFPFYEWPLAQSSTDRMGSGRVIRLVSARG